MSKKPIFDKILIANRGEIACRVIKTCRRLGIKTVAIHSTADEQAKHVRMADEAVCVGPPASAESYLVIEKVIDACVKTGAQAVHPGYGFLSENEHFSAALKKNNIVFIGPDADAIADMGDKIHSKKLAKAAGVTTIPGYIGEILSHKQLLEVANEITYPVMVKASGGGGGKGMRVAYNDTECVEFFDMCKEEAKAAFNNDKMLVEKFIEHPRHIEVQVIADRLGNAVYLNERECSIQRRNQKVLEEAPSELIDAKTRKAMGEQAVALAKAVNYVTAGTVENVVNPKREFFFLEMNTRLQVEHPITELITGVDIVEQMIRASAGLPLSITQDDVKIHGHATEARVYAEDPMKNYFPSIGRLSGYEEPVGEGVRVDSGILEGSQISVYYDPLIAKLCTWGATRDESLDRMEKALDEYVIRGLRHNVCLLRDVITQEKYRKAEITTAYLAETYPDGFKKAPINEAEQQLLLSTSAVIRAIREAALYPTKGGLISTRLAASLGFADAASRSTFDIVQTAATTYEVSNVATGEKKILDVQWKRDFPVVRVTENGKETVLQFWGSDEVTYNMQMKGTTFAVTVMTPQQAELSGFVPEPKVSVNAKQVLSPMPGVIVHLNVEVGQTVVAGFELFTLEAMKMRNKIRSEADGKIKSINVKTGATVDDGQLIIEFE
ncbi:carboxylase, putative [Bodo saltans]|uniref:Carboxylase, putative n=1 Tax=Bodo saltans TaxID=75058 RepID=A0A0S4JIQ8_BODSA|nr:carboxylase, putative [Bodo saltans]|eukprot:CUG91340.1 carboxylase, putative [Bodo saltans]